MKLQLSHILLLNLAAFALISFSFAVPSALGNRALRSGHVFRVNGTSFSAVNVPVRDLVASPPPPLETEPYTPNPRPSPPPPPCKWIRDVMSVTWSDADCMPYHWTSHTKRTVKHTLASNEVSLGDCGIFASDEILNNSDLSWSVEETDTTVKVVLKNHGLKFCYADKDFGAGCMVDRYVC